MQRTIALVAAAALSLSPTVAFGQTAPGNGQFNGQNYNHSNSGNASGQPGADCEFLVANNLGATPGNASSAPGSAFNPDGNAGTHYAGEQPQNQRNSASVAQYDTACSHQQPG